MSTRADKADNDTIATSLERDTYITEYLLSSNLV